MLNYFEVVFRRNSLQRKIVWIVVYKIQHLNLRNHSCMNSISDFWGFVAVCECCGQSCGSTSYHLAKRGLVQYSCGNTVFSARIHCIQMKLSHVTFILSFFVCNFIYKNRWQQLIVDHTFKRIHHLYIMSWKTNIANGHRKALCW